LSKAPKPHSQVDSFSGSGFLGERIKFIKTNPILNARAINKKIIIDRYSDKKSKIIAYQYLPQYL
jgi:hypothetical protein